MAIAWVQGTSVLSAGSGATTTAATTGLSAVGSGNMVAVWVTYIGTSQTVTITDNIGGNTYTAVDTSYWAGPNYYIATFYCLNITNGPSTFTATVGSNVTWFVITADEFSGVKTSAALDQHTIVQSNAPGLGVGAITTGNVTTGTNGELVYGVGRNISDAVVLNPGPGFTGLQTNYNDSEWLVQGTAGVTAGTWTFASGTGNEAVLVGVMTFKPPATGGAPAGNQYDSSLPPFVF